MNFSFLKTPFFIKTVTITVLCLLMIYPFITVKEIIYLDLSPCNYETEESCVGSCSQICYWFTDTNNNNDDRCFTPQKYQYEYEYENDYSYNWSKPNNYMCKFFVISYHYILLAGLSFLINFTSAFGFISIIYSIGRCFYRCKKNRQNYQEIEN